MNEKLIELLCAALLEKQGPTAFTEPPKTNNHSFIIDKPYLIRTVTMMYTGRIIAITDCDLLLEDAAWIADSGRYHNALVSGSLDEVEPYPETVIVTRQSIVDAAPWKHALPQDQK